ncbi:MAG: YeeE/YedE family protein [Deltaproteobacteria bacterium]|jgi:uncharacterized protein|nr:YeeE/YedE family protein [Deltaproteobacteria bacterium]MBT6433485.1 YeeE/YedE family protein [Deltaproteobacteria bacterium]MBT6491591.1 YeeE/YedE family protein [Deltaproteobacteria bacterium]
MTDADKVIGFLDLGGEWDASLAFVMLGAIGVHIIFYRLIIRRESPTLEQLFKIPDRSDINFRLISGAAIFGTGWGLGGFCPAPALVSMAALQPESLTFSLFMLVGMAIHQLQTKFEQRSPPEKHLPC